MESELHSPRELTTLVDWINERDRLIAFRTGLDQQQTSLDKQKTLTDALINQANHAIEHMKVEAA